VSIQDGVEEQGDLARKAVKAGILRPDANRGVQISATVPEGLRKELEGAAEAQERTIGVVVKRAVEHYLHCVEVEANCPHAKDDRS
jgi:hypothetical protein